MSEAETKLISQEAFDEMKMKEMKSYLRKNHIAFDRKIKRKVELSSLYSSILSGETVPCSCANCCKLPLKQQIEKCGMTNWESIKDAIEEVVGTTEFDQNIPGTLNIFKQMAENENNNESGRKWAHNQYVSFAGKAGKLVESVKECGFTKRAAEKWGRLQADVDAAVEEARSVKGLLED